jgi:hypothetical protein
MQLEELFNREEAARFIRETYKMKCKASSLGVYATVGTGPKFQRRGGSVVYARADLVEWAEGKITNRSARSSELRPAAA